MSAIPQAAPPSPTEARLDQQLCLALYTASRSMTARYRLALADLGLTYPQYLVMVLLWEEGPCSVSGIGQRLSLDSSTLSPLLKRLQAMGLVTRTRAVTDERLMIIGLTEQGSAMEAAHGSVAAEMCDATGIDDAGRLELTTTLRELSAQLDAATRQASA